MRLGKRKEKEKDHSELKSHGAEGITRLICLSKGQNPLKGKNQSFIYYSERLGESAVTTFNPYH